MDLRHLNPSQRQAVECTEGPLLVLAGAGSGKTRVITHRIVRILEQGTPPERVVALSFTNKAADEMRERLAGMAGKRRAEELVLGTFHSLGVRMLKEDPEGFRIPKRFTILDQGDVFGVVRALLREEGIHVEGNRRFDLGAVVQRISLWKNEFLDQDAVTKRARYGTEYDEAAAKIYGAYEDRLRSLGAVDFDDLVCHIADVLRSDEEVRARWQARFDYLMVDEYQDTNQAQFEMLRQLLGPHQNLAVVGDDDQAIYGWRGAKVGLILGFDMYFPEARTVRLEENYRSRAPITRAANALIVHNKSRHDKRLIPTRGEGEPVAQVLCRDPEQEAKWVADKVRKLMVDDRVRPEHIAVLYRSSRQTRMVEANLQEHGLPYRVLGGQSFYDKKEVKDVLAYLKVLVTPRDDLAVRRALDTPHRGVGRKTMERLSAFAAMRHVSLAEAIGHLDEIEGISGRPKAALERFHEQISRTRRRIHAEKSAVAPLRDLVAELRLRENVRKETGSAKAAQARWAGVEWLFESLDRFESRSAGQWPPKWREYLNAQERTKEEDAPEENTGEVTLATMHSAKGLEWPCVFILGCEEGTLPHKRVDANRISDAISGDIEEERRLFYVGITRARDRLWLTRAATKVERGKELEIQPSRFLKELPEDEIERYDVAERDQLSSDQMNALADALFAKYASSE